MENGDVKATSLQTANASFLRFDVRDLYQLIIILGITSMTLGVCMIGFGLASMLVEHVNSPTNIGVFLQMGPVLVVGLFSASIGAICLVIGNKIYPSAWKCNRDTHPWPPYPEISAQQHFSWLAADDSESETCFIDK